MPRKKLTDKQKELLNNDDVPLVTLRKAMKAFEEGDVHEADRLYNLVKAQARREGKRK